MFHSIPVVSDLCRQFLVVVLIILAIMFLLCLVRLILGPFRGRQTSGNKYARRNRFVCHRNAFYGSGGNVLAGHRNYLCADQFFVCGSPYADLYWCIPCAP